MATMTTYPSVQLDRTQRDGLFHVAVEDWITMSPSLPEEEHVHAFIGLGRIFGALVDDDPTREAWPIVVDDDVVWMVREHLRPSVVDSEYFKDPEPAPEYLSKEATAYYMGHHEMWAARTRGALAAADLILEVA